MNETLAHYLRAFERLNVNRTRGHASPHKPCMLLAVLGLAIEANAIKGKVFFMQTVKGVITGGFVLTAVIYAVLACAV